MTELQGNHISHLLFCDPVQSYWFMSFTGITKISNKCLQLANKTWTQC